MSQGEINFIVLISFLGGLIIGIICCSGYIRFYHSQMKLNKEIEKGKKIDEYNLTNSSS